MQLFVHSESPITKVNINRAFDKAKNQSHNPYTLLEFMKMYLPRLNVFLDGFQIIIQNRKKDNIAKVLLA